MKKLYVSLALLSSLVCVSSAFADAPGSSAAYCAPLDQVTFAFTNGTATAYVSANPSILGGALPKKVYGFDISSKQITEGLGGNVGTTNCYEVTLTQQPTTISGKALTHNQVTYQPKTVKTIPQHGGQKGIVTYTPDSRRF